MADGDVVEFRHGATTQVEQMEPRDGKPSVGMIPGTRRLSPA